MSTKFPVDNGNCIKVASKIITQFALIPPNAYLGVVYGKMDAICVGVEVFDGGGGRGVEGGSLGRGRGDPPVARQALLLNARQPGKCKVNGLVLCNWGKKGLIHVDSEGRHSYFSAFKT